MGIIKTTRAFEKWLGRQTPLIDADVNHKHEAMSEAAFPFLRATFYRWMELWPRVSPSLNKAPSVLAVGDLHVDNFGTWRDAQGRLTWGINDFDEAFPLPYTFDLVRLATSALLEIRSEHLAISEEKACRAILAGYRESLSAGGRPIVVDAAHRWLTPLIGLEARDPTRYWQKIDALPELDAPPSAPAIQALAALLPHPKLQVRYAHRIAGLGSLGKQRTVALADWNGGHIARECKPLTPSAAAWIAGKRNPKIYYGKILKTAIRSPDPLFIVHGNWIVRRLAPDCSRIALASLTRVRDDEHLLHAMGWETANIHLGTPGAADAIARDLKRRQRNWLGAGAEKMLAVTLKDWLRWKEGSVGVPAV